MVQSTKTRYPLNLKNTYCIIQMGHNMKEIRQNLSFTDAYCSGMRMIRKSNKLVHERRLI